MRALLNGEEAVRIGGPDDLVSVAYSPARPQEPALVTVARPKSGWQAQLTDVHPCHLSPLTSAGQADFRFFHWRERDLLCLAGDARAYLVRGADGSIAAALGLELTDQSSLDLIEILPSSAGDKLLVLSTRVGWLITDNEERPRRLSIPGIADSVHAQASGFLISYMDAARTDLRHRSLSVE